MGISMLLFTSSPATAIQVSHPQPANRLLLRSIGSLAEDAPLAAGNKVLLRGVVTYLGNRTIGASAIYIQDQTGAIALDAENAPPLALGDEVEALGTYRRITDQSFIEAAQIHQIWSGSDPIPLALRPDQAVEGAYNGWLVQIQGRLIQKTLNAQGATLALESEHQFFTASLNLSTPGFNNILADYDPGMVLDVTGVCSAPFGKFSSTSSGFVILLRSLDDIRVVRPAPWWNPRHAIMLSPLLLLLLFALHRVHVYNLNLRFRAVIDERSRIAREMHDTMAQGFSGVALQLEGVADALRASTVAQKTCHNLDIALRMVRHSRDEAHDSIFVLRSLLTRQVDLLHTLVQSAELKMTGRKIEVLSSQCGNAYPISDEVKHNLLRIGQEAISNTLRHAESTRLFLTLRYLPRQIEFEIADNGIGFDPACVKSIDTGHFGLAGMQERAALIGARLEIDSSPGQGTRVRITVTRSRGLISPILYRAYKWMPHV